MKEVAKSWKDWKARVKKDYYKKFTTDEARLAFTPPRVNEEQWRTLVAYWGTGQKLHVDFNSQWQPIGPNKNAFTTQIGLLAKNTNIVPLTCVCWTDMPTSSLDAIWKEVKVCN